MGGEENAMGFQNGNESILSTNVSEMAMSSVTMAKPSSDNNPFLVSSSNWDPLSMVVSHNDFVNSNSNSSPYPNLVLENHHQGMSSGTSSQFVHYMCESNLGGIISSSKVHHSFGSGSFSEMVVGSFGDVNNTRFRAHSMNGEQSQVDDSVLEEGGSGPSGNSRKRGLDHCSTFSPNKDGEGDALKDSPGKSSDGQREHEKKPKVEQNASVDLRGKQPAKQAIDSSQSGEAPKENFIHVRARRGQATNSHSLAERVRREKISERMRLLQELVPGCSKITGKAVMLDEIINYVQSLQQQVEFLSMKLATVNPELNFDVERILSKDILQTRIGHGIGGYGISSSHSHPPFHSGNFQGTLAGMPSTSTQFPPLPQAVLDHEFQSFYGMGYDSSTALDTLGPNGRLKTEL